MTSAGHDLLLASVLVRLGEQERAGEIYRRLLADQPDQPQVWQNLGHVQNAGAAGRGGGGLPPGGDAPARHGRSVVEPGQPENGEAGRGRYCRDGSRAHLAGTGGRGAQGGYFPPAFLAGQSL
jgi:hypothetical protein